MKMSNWIPKTTLKAISKKHCSLIFEVLFDGMGDLLWAKKFYKHIKFFPWKSISFTFILIHSPSNNAESLVTIKKQEDFINEWLPKTKTKFIVYHQDDKWEEFLSKNRCEKFIPSKDKITFYFNLGMNKFNLHFAKLFKHKNTFFMCEGGYQVADGETTISLGFGANSMGIPITNIAKKSKKSLKPKKSNKIFTCYVSMGISILYYIHLIENTYPGKKTFYLLGKGCEQLKNEWKKNFDANIKNYTSNKIINKSLSHDEFMNLLRKSESPIGCTGDQSLFEVISTNHVPLYERLQHKGNLVSQHGELCEKILNDSSVFGALVLTYRCCSFNNTAFAYKLRYIDFQACKNCSTRNIDNAVNQYLNVIPIIKRNCDFKKRFVKWLAANIK
jgi:hypothetical protein